MRLCVYPWVSEAPGSIALLAQDPGRDPALERRSPEANGGEHSIELPLVHLLASARPVPSGLRFPGTIRRREAQLRCHTATTPWRLA